MFREFCIGKLFNEGVFGYEEGIKFDINDNGCVVNIYFTSPTVKEIDEITRENMKMAYYDEDEVIFMLFKFGDLNWMDAPYSIHLSKNLTKLEDIKEGTGLKLQINFIDAHTGILMGMRLVALLERFSRNLKKKIDQQRLMTFNVHKYNAKIDEVFRKYSTKILLKYSKDKCSV